MATLFRRSRAFCQCQRQFSTSVPRAVSLQWDKNDPEALAEVLPPYPYGPTRWYKQSRLGLYGGQRVQFGNNVSGPFKAKTRRTWHPNIFTRKIFSKALNRMVQVRVSARVLRTIDKLGGLDEYLLGEKPARIKELGESGWWLRWAIMQTPAVKMRFAEERVRLGLPEQREEAEALPEALAAPEEDALAEDEGQSVEDMEAVPMDDAFQLEQDESLPPIKFRVGRGQHVMLTANGWIRTRPDPSYFVDKEKLRLSEEKFPDFVDAGMKLFEAKLDERMPQMAHMRNKFIADGKKSIDEKYKRRVRVERDEFVRDRFSLFEEEYDQRAQLKREAAGASTDSDQETHLEEQDKQRERERLSRIAADPTTDFNVKALEDKSEELMQLGREAPAASLNAEERALLLKEARRSLRKELQEKVDRLFDARQTLKNGLTAQRRALKQEKKNAAKAEQDAALELV